MLIRDSAAPTIDPMSTADVSKRSKTQQQKLMLDKCSLPAQWKAAGQAGPMQVTKMHRAMALLG
jgi:hypothetical protein